MVRLAFKMQLNPGQVEVYKKRHDEIWPKLTALLKETGVHDYSIFLDESTLGLFGVLKVESIEKFNALPTHKIMQEWWKYMSDIMQTNPDQSPIAIPLPEMFYLQ